MSYEYNRYGVYVGPTGGYDYAGRKRPTRRRTRRQSTQAKPKNLREIIARVRKDKNLNVGMEMLKDRKGEFDDSFAADLAAIALHPPARSYLDEQLDRIWGENDPPQQADEVVIGAGFHAAVYSSTRVAAGHQKPLVLEGGENVGGTFAMSKGPSFYLNSRNRPGGLGIPGREEALNVLPRGPIQPSELSGAEYQRNSDLSFAVRCALAQNARIVTGFKVTFVDQVRDKGGWMRIYSADGQVVKAKRVIWATGLGEERKPIEHDRLLSFSEFMARMDEPFPLRGMKNIAVVGAGDSGKTTIEALIGQAPGSGASVAALDHPENIDWYGVPYDCSSKSGWRNSTRSRYQGIARELPRNVGRREESRVFPVADRNEGTIERAEQVSGGLDGVMVNGRMYDYVIWCGGYEDNLDRRKGRDGEFKTVNERAVARRLATEVFEVGPAAGLPMDSYETRSLPSAVPENTVALFRYADRTATLANTLPKAGERA